MDEALRSRILEVLRRQHIMTVATIRPDGYPQATTELSPNLGDGLKDQAAAWA
jgi:hypothetical protein